MCPIATDVAIATISRNWRNGTYKGVVAIKKAAN